MKSTSLLAVCAFAAVIAADEVVEGQYNPWSRYQGSKGAADGGSSSLGATWKDSKRNEPSKGGWSVMIPKGIMPSTTKINGLPVDINLNIGASPLFLHDRPEEVVLAHGVIDYHSLHPETLRKIIEHIDSAQKTLQKPEVEHKCSENVTNSTPTCKKNKRDTALLPEYNALDEKIAKDSFSRGGVDCPTWCNANKDHWRCHIPMPSQCYCYNDKCLRPGAEGDPFKFETHGFPINGVMYPEGLSG